jgi:hypothetical protein
MSVTKAQLRKIALSFPEALEKPSYGRPAYFVAKKFFTRHREDDDSIVWFVGSIDERDHLLEIDPKTYFITDHYRDYPCVLVRMARIDTTMLQKMLDRRWRAIAPKKLLRELDAPAVPKVEKKKRAPTKTKTKTRSK